MFDRDFYPTPPDVAERMLAPIDIRSRFVLEPSAGRGDLARACLAHGAQEVLVCENNVDLRHLAARVGNLIEPDFLDVTADRISHVSAVVMNPPFSADEQHILHAWSIAPPGCVIVALCNASTIGDKWSSRRRELGAICEAHGVVEDLGAAFADADRATGVKVTLVRLTKPGASPDQEWEGFFIGPDDVEAEGEGIIPYTLAREVVNRYCTACRIFDEQLQLGVRMSQALGGLYGSELAFMATEGGEPLTRNRFRKDLQKAAWNFVFQKIGMEKFATRQLRADINVFVEQQQRIPFTMRNIYRMIEIVACTHESRVDRAVEDAFDSLTKYHDENRYHLPGWKTNSSYLFARKFIAPYTCEKNYHSRTVDLTLYRGSGEQIDDLVKALCYLTGGQYDDVTDAKGVVTKRGVGKPEQTRNLNPGEWYDWGFFQFKCFLKGTIHLQFKDTEVWEALNRRVAKIKGYTLPEKL